ncbi:MAG: DUF4252 domain-containing protein [Bacteroidaceae bacterium]|nr:DUF4252 domain-containing protein [Bacteroidaceae bacterium]MBR3896029.1 DUF4252 domain-containing protein [Bacteroidaceae bacterium]
MKRIICIIATLVMIMQGGMAQTVNGLFRQFKDLPEAEYKNLAPLLMGVIKTFAIDEEDDEVIKSIKSIKVLDLEECAPEIRREYARKTRNLKPRGMEMLMQVKEDDGTVCIWGKIKREKVKQVLVLTPDKMVSIKGKFDLEKISQLLNQD